MAFRKCVTNRVNNNSSVHYIPKRDEHTHQVRLSFHWKRILKFVFYVSVLITFAVYMASQSYQTSEKVCYKRVGCFFVSGPWLARPNVLNFYPQSPAFINTTFIATSRKNWNGQLAKARHSSNYYNGFRSFLWGNEDDVIFLIHGFTDDSSTWMLTLKDAYLNLRDTTVILVDWSRGASGYYPQIVANTRVVAREISLFIRYVKTLWITPKRIHLVGHSLGAHIASYVGKSIGNVYQITALDPAFPLFEGFPSPIRLHKEDAKHVLIFHSNIGPWGLGMKNPVGSVSIYLNNGRDQKGCTPMTSILNEPLKLDTGLEYGLMNLKDVIVCSHRRAYEILEDILKSLANSTQSKFLAYSVVEMESESKKVNYSFCLRNIDSCWELQENTATFFQLPEHFSSTNSVFFMPTTDKSPFCARLAFLEIEVCNLQITTVDLLQISYNAFGEEVVIYSGQIYKNLKIEYWIEFSCDSLVQQDKLNLELSLTVLSRLPGSIEEIKKIFQSRSSRNTWDRVICFSELHLSHSINDKEILVRSVPKKEIPMMMFYDMCHVIPFQTIETNKQTNYFFDKLKGLF
ncbi:unnamed protein product [Orchesella dallaii]|uniref:Lipase domain-containing protein n=1 Tax=Orchesella dallaii TaxID=48710 RepID=A0ABP1QGP7_9HEXA